MKRFLLIIISAPVVFSVWGQSQNSISQQIEVTREFRPDVARAYKLDIQPQMSDTVSLRPQIDYSITPTPWNTVFDTGPIRPVRISAAEYIPAWPFYVRMGGGYPGMVMADVYATAQGKKGNYGGVYANNYGEYAKLKNDMDEKLSGKRMRTMVGGFFNVPVWRGNFTAEVSYDNRIYNPFGAFVLEDMPLTEYRPGSLSSIRYNDLSGRITLGDSFKDFSRFNWNIALGAGWFRDRKGFEQSTFSGDVRIGAGLGRGHLMLDAGITGRRKTGDFPEQENTMIATIQPKFEWVASNLNIVIGAEFAIDHYDDDTKLYVFPEVKISYDIKDLFTIYAKVDGEVADGSFRTLTYANPYIEAGSWLKSSQRLGMRAGFFGAIGSFLSYEVFGGYDSYEDYHYFANLYNEGNTTRFRAFGGADPNIYYVGAMFRARITRGLGLDFDARMSGYGDIKEGYEGSVAPALDIPNYELDVLLHYNHNRKLFISLGVEVLGATKSSVAYEDGALAAYVFRNEKRPATVNLRAGVEFAFTRQANMFITADNLLNEKIYRFNHYPQLGTNVMAGLKFRF